MNIRDEFLKWIKQFVVSKVQVTVISDNVISLSDKKSSCVLIYVDCHILLVTNKGITYFKEKKGKWKAINFLSNKEVVEM